MPCCTHKFNNRLFTTLMFGVCFLQSVTKSCITLLKAISGNDDVKVAVVKAGIVDLLLKALDQHSSNPQVRRRSASQFCHNRWPLI